MAKGTNELDAVTAFADTDSLIVDSDSENITGRLTGSALKAYIRQPSGKRYGYRVNLNTADCDARVEYIYDAVGMTPASMGSSSFSYGSWENIWFVADNHPAMITAAGALDYKLFPSNYSLKSDGKTASDVTNSAYNGNAMSGIPTVWYKRWTEGNYRYFVCSDTQYDETYCADVHQRADGTIGSYKYIGMFDATLVGGKLRSMLFTSTQPANTLTHDQFLTYAQVNGPEWILGEWGAYELLADLLTLMSKSTNGQAKFGRGRITKSDGSTAGSAIGDALMPGANNFSTRGQFFGFPNSNIYPVKVFHVENFWGNLWVPLMGCLQIGGYLYTRMNSYGGEYNLAGVDYKRSSVPLSTTNNSLIVKTWAGREGVIPTTGDASTTQQGILTGHATYEADHFYIDTSITALCRASGGCNAGLHCGPRVRALAGAPSVAGWHVGASLSLKNPL